MVIIKVKIGIRKEEVVVIIVKKFIIGIYALKSNLFRLVARVSHYRVYKWELKLIATYLTIL